MGSDRRLDMPGFTVGGRGGGPNHMIETRRKHRWIFRTLGQASLGDFDPPVLLILKEASRPQPTIEEPEMHHNQEKAYFAGKHSWEPCKMVWYDGEQSPDVSEEMWKWLNGVIEIHGANLPVEVPGQYKKEGTLAMLRGDGDDSETWRMYGCWPQTINWNNLDYMDTEIQTIEVTMRFDRAVRE
jgi:hypothetical protein